MRPASPKLVFVAGVLLATAPVLGNAQDYVEGGRPADGTSPFGAYFLLGGGVTDFTKTAEKDRFDVGGTWDARLGVGSRSFIGGELGYVGSFRSGKSLGPDLLANGAEGVIRLQFPYTTTGGWLVEPFAFGGIGWSHLSLRNAPAGITGTDNIGVVPFGAGVMFGVSHFLVDARFTYRTAFNEDLRVAAGASTINAQQWAVGASIGYEF